MGVEMSFLSHALLRRSDAYEEHGDVFFYCMPFRSLRVQGPENRDELQQELDKNIPLRFTPIFGAQHRLLFQGQNTKKDISVLTIHFLS
jgi:hypothetical protein